MKKITLLAVVVVAGSFASCKKDRVCTCKSSSAGSTEWKRTFIDAKKGAASSACLSYSEDYTNGSTTTKVTTTCTLD